MVHISIHLFSNTISCYHIATVQRLLIPHPPLPPSHPSLRIYIRGYICIIYRVYV